ncbi:hypothetical protein QN404_27280, partial [Pseudomonas sp. RTS1]|uniref:hypothetical protein n=2 Tax=unclassified Pseudomonas TaxID=196821 RepID=UPI002B22FE1F
SRSSSRLNSETPIAKAVGVLFWALEKNANFQSLHSVPLTPFVQIPQYQSNLACYQGSQVVRRVFISTVMYLTETHVSSEL